MSGILNKALTFVAVLLLGVSIAEAPAPATPTDLDYIMGPLEMVDGTESDDESFSPYVYIEFEDLKTPITLGDELTMRCVIVGYDPAQCIIQWQYSTELDGEYQDIDCHEERYTFKTNRENIGYYYRVMVTHR